MMIEPVKFQGGDLVLIEAEQAEGEAWFRVAYPFAQQRTIKPNIVEIRGTMEDDFGGTWEGDLEFDITLEYEVKRGE